MYDIYNTWESAISIISYDSVLKKVYFIGDAQNPFLLNTDSLHYNVVLNCESDMNSLNVRSHFGKTYFTYYTFPGFSFNDKINYWSVIIIEDTSNVLSINHRISYKLYKIKANGDTLYSNLIECPVQNFVSSKLIHIKDKIYFYGNEGRYSTSSFSILCTDTLGKKIWYKKYTGRRCFTTSFVDDIDGNFLVGGGLYKGDGITDTVFGWYTKMDTTGNFIWEKIQSDTTPFLGGNPLIINNSYYWISSRSDQNKMTYAYIFKTDHDGNITTQKIILNGFVNNNGYMRCDMSNAIVKNNNIYGIGTYSDTNGFMQYTQYIQFVKLDTSGNIKWRRVFKQWYQNNNPYSLTAMSDGFIICADGKDTTHATGFTDAWLIKTDTNGCVVPGCNARDGIVQIINPEAFVKVYPNPASTVLNIEITDERAKAKNFFMYDNIGSLVTKKNVNAESNNYVFPTSDIKNGLYYFVIELQDGSQAVKKVLIEK